MTNSKRHHQAKELELVFQEVRQHEKNLHHPSAANISLEDNDGFLKVDVLNLPPRREVHQVHDKGLKLKFSKALWRLIVVLILLFGITIFALYDLLFAQEKFIF